MSEQRSNIFNDDTTVTTTSDAAAMLLLLPCIHKHAQSYFHGKHVLLTGASGGLGRALALQLIRCGVGTLILSARSRSSLEDVSRECHELLTALATTTTTIHVMTCDLSQPDSVATLAHDVLQVCDTINVLINNGGVSSRSRFVDTKFEVDTLLMQVNFLAGAALAKAFVPGMVQQGWGAILWISSVQGLVGIPNRTSYAASKFAVQGYCEALRGELATSGVTVHVASPGYIRTNLSRSAITGDGTKHGQLDDTTAKGADPNDVAVTILNSASEGKADFIVAATFSAKAAIWLRLLAPSMLQRMLVKRYEKSRTQERDDNNQDSSVAFLPSSKQD